MKLQNGEAESVVEKLSSEIEAFLQAKRSSSTDRVTKEPTIRRSSLESVPLNMAASAPQDCDENDSAGSESNCFELEKMKAKKRVGSSERASAGLSPSSMQVKFEERMAQATSHGESSNRVEGAEHDKPGETSVFDQREGTNGVSSNHMIENLMRNQCLISENGSKKKDQDYGISAMWRSQPSPVRRWSEKLVSSDRDVLESSTKQKESTLKAKLLEARPRAQRSRSRLKASIFPSRKE